MADFWSNFTYAIFIIERYTDGSIKLKYVTEIDNEKKTFKYNTQEEVKEKNLEIKLLKKQQAIELMNCISCNGYEVAMQPYFKN